MKKLFIDLDNVIYDTVQIIKDLYDEHFAYYQMYEDIPVEKLISYDFSEFIFIRTIW